ncbi:MAG TPA: hypothetical protein VGN07_22475 [Steroidobacteraceae bacterium]|jgi:hypothetical protein
MSVETQAHSDFVAPDEIGVNSVAVAQAIKQDLVEMFARFVKA